MIHLNDGDCKVKTGAILRNVNVTLSSFAADDLADKLDTALKNVRDEGWRAFQRALRDAAQEIDEREV